MTEAGEPEVRRQRWETRYLDADLPWDTGITPPEVQSFWASARAPRQGVAIDLGCGTGTNVLFLAKQGVTGIGVELAGTALTRARRRVHQVAPGVRSHAFFVQADVARLPFSRAHACYILDVGCLHGVPPAERRSYAQGILSNLAPGGYYHLYAFDRVEPDPNDPEKLLRGMEDGEVETLFAPDLAVVEVIRGVPDRYPCRWYLLRRHT